MKRCLTLILFFMLLFSLNAKAEEGYSDDFRYSVMPKDSLLSEDTELNDPSSVMKDLEKEHLFSYLGRQLSSAFRGGFETLIKGIAMVLFSVVVNRCSGNIQNQNLQLLFSFIVSISIALMCEESLRSSAEALKKAIEDMGIFTAACIPSFAVVMTAAGEGAGSTVFSAAMVLLGEIGTLVSNHLLLPLVDVFLAIGICSAVSDEYNFMTIGRNIRRFLVWVIGLLVMAFQMMMKLQSGAAAAGDQVAKKYIRSALASLIPMVGNTLSDGIDGLFAVASGVRVSFAIAGVLIIISIVLPSLLSIMIYGFGWKVCRWTAELMNDAAMRSISDVLANCYFIMLALGGAVALLGLFSFFGLILRAV